MTQEITELSPPRSWAVHGVDGPIRPRANVTVEPLGDGAGSRVTFALDFEGHGIGKPLVPADLLTSGAFDRHLRRCRCATAAGATGWAPPLPSTRRHSGWPVSPPACTRSCPSPSRARPSRRSSPTPPPTRSPLTASGLLALGSPTSRWPGHRLRQPTRARRPAADLRRRGAG